MRIFRFTLLTGISLAVACGADHHDDRENIDGGGSDASLSRDGSSFDGSVGMDAAGLDGARDAPDGSSVLPDGSPFSTNPQGQVLCGTTACACSNGTDDDHDGLIDLADPECVSSWDNDEGSFATGIPGDNRDTACQDCFFDGNSGSGNDGCRIATSCLTNAMDSSSGRGSCNTCTANAMCRSTCQAYTPNGCDCFGCCTVHLGSNITKSVLLASGCDINGTDTSGCTECIPSTSCVNTCGECELCPGKTAADLPPSCATNGADGGMTSGGSDAGVPVPSCDNGQQPCSDGSACPTGQLCQYGCCQLSPIILL
ncbi:MAG TPA: hypothetical protein VI299_21740 [Polyangiales bacterium]